MLIVNLEIAKLLKVLDFDEKCRNHYLEGISKSTHAPISKLVESNFEYTNTELDENFSDCTSKYTGVQRYSAPDVTDVVRWIKDKYKLYITLLPNFKWDGVTYRFQITEYNPNAPRCIGEVSIGAMGDFNEYDTYLNSIRMTLDIIGRRR